jgi:hypothetical protein
MSRHEPAARATVCPRCGEPLPTGWVRDCKDCDRRRARSYYECNREAVLARARARRGPPPQRYCTECSVELSRAGSRRLLAALS